MTNGLQTLALESGDARASVAPARGALVTRFSVAGRELLFLDESTLLDPQKNVRGGVPVLFPSPGRLGGGRWQRGGHSGAMAQHGFGRNLPWEVVACSAAEATLRLVSTPETLAQFPWSFVAEHRVSLRGPALRIEQEYRNTGGEPMPFASGFHPYFAVPQADKARTRVETAATRALDNTRGVEVKLSGPIDLTAAEVDLHLIDHGASAASLLLADGRRIEVRGSPEYKRWVTPSSIRQDADPFQPALDESGPGSDHRVI